jgi:hypothetical protein
MKLKELEGYEGGDVDLEASLYEYGLIWKEIPEEKFFIDPRNPDAPTFNTEYEFIFGIDFGEERYLTFDNVRMSKAGFIELLRESWIDLPGVLKFCSRSFDGLIKDFPSSISIMLDYYGYQNIFGDSPCPFMIE